ncbi:hypothetical protein VNI00_017416 [Paramarasmius palmivorus]|uniref:Uncharacterized protein n=1 Tax=Paramarasmius palmivorus TaxID=297713 RepID=A0AAW0B6V6_9AGAR
MNFDLPNHDSGLSETGPVIIQTEIDDIKTEYHPASGRGTEQKRFGDYGFQQEEEYREPINKEPWRLFPTRFDFEVAELALDCAMNKKQTDTHDQLEKIWDVASEKTAKWHRTEISPSLDGEAHRFDVFLHPTWDWIEEVLKDPKIASQMEWDTCRNYRFDGSCWERFITELWTSDLWWDIQTTLNSDPSLGSNAKSLFLIIYADKNKLSTFGTAKGYPVIAQIGNVPSDLRNTNGLSGG